MAVYEVTNDSAFPALVLRARAKRGPLAAPDRATGHLRGAVEGAAGGNQARRLHPAAVVDLHGCPKWGQVILSFCSEIS